MTTRIIVSILIGSFVPALFWIGGYDFNERGEKAVWCALATLTTALWVFLYPTWDEKEDK